MIKLNNNKYEYFDSNGGLIALFLTILFFRLNVFTWLSITRESFYLKKDS